MLPAISLWALFLLSADFVVSADSSHQTCAQAVFCNNQYYVFWSDSRFAPSQNLFAIYVSRVTADGRVVDPHGKPLYIGIAKFEPQVAFDGTSFLVVFRDGC